MTKSLFLSFALLCSGTAFAVPTGSVFILAPQAETLRMCKELKFEGEFRMVRDPKQRTSWALNFQNGNRANLKAVGNDLYENRFGCVVGCVGSVTIQLNLKTKTFFYSNSIDRDPADVCRGRIFSKGRR